MFRRLLSAALALAAFGALTAAEARDRQVVIATQSLDPSGTSATIDLSKAKGAFSAVRVRAKKGPVEISGLRFVYSDDTFHSVDKTFTLKSGEGTKLLDERDADRFVDSLAVTYKADGKPVVLEITGIQSRSGARMVRAKPAANVAAAPAPGASGAAPAPAAGGQGATTTAALPAPKPKPLLADPKTIIEGRDVMFGYRDIALSDDRAQLRVAPEVGKFHAVRVRAAEGDINVGEIEIVYTDGSKDTLTIDSPIKAGQKSKWFAIAGKEPVKEASIALKPKANAKGRARIELLGQYSSGWLGANGEGRKFNKGWVLLGSETAGSIGFDKDVVSVGENDGKFSKLLLQVRDRSITLREIRVVYQDGKDEVIRSNDRVDPDQVAGPWELKSGGSPVKEIVAVHRRRILIGKGEGSPVVEFWGQH